MQELKVDVAILGAGTAGLGARRSAKSQGKKAVMIDPGPFGTTCARVGCMPSKLLIAAAEAAHHAGHAHQFGVHVEGIRVDDGEVLGRVRRERDRFVGFVNQAIDTAKAEGELIVGRGNVTAPGVIEVDSGTRVLASSLVVATGTVPFIPPPFRPFEDLLWTNEHIFEMEKLPKSVLVVGTGVIGLELGQALHRLGSDVTIVGIRNVVGPLSDPEVKASAHKAFAEEFKFFPNYDLKTIERRENGVFIRFDDGSSNIKEGVFERILMAAGRRPTLDRLGLENWGLEPGPKKDYGFDARTLQLADKPVFVAGDANFAHPLLHEAADDGRIAGANAANFPQVQVGERRAPLGIVFTDPQIAVVGKGYAQLKGCETHAGMVDYSDQGRARVMLKNKGAVRIYADSESGVLIGAEMAGPSVEHTAHLLAWAVQQRLTVNEALKMPFYHPVVEEGIRTALRDLAKNLRVAAPVNCTPCEQDGPGG